MFVLKNNLTRTVFNIQVEVGGLVYTVISWYREGFKESTRDMAKIACRLLREPLFPALESIGIGK